MGLAISVGALVVFKDDEGWCESTARDLAKLNGFLVIAGLPQHKEPTDLGGADPFSCEM